MRQIWKEEIFENTIILLFVKSVCYYLGYRTKCRHTVNEIFGDDLVVFPALRDVTS